MWDDCEGIGRLRDDGDDARWQPRTYVSYRTPQPVVVDGNLDEAIWWRAEWSDPFVFISAPLLWPSPHPIEPQDTRMAMVWDDENLYVAIRLQEENVWGRLTKRDYRHLQRQRQRDVPRPQRGRRWLLRDR